MVAELECADCGEMINKRVRDILVVWSTVKVRTDQHIFMCNTDLRLHSEHDLM